MLRSKPLPAKSIKIYLEKKHAIKPTMYRHMWAQYPQLENVNINTMRENLEVLKSYKKSKEEVTKTIFKTPHLLGSSLKNWCVFLKNYGVSEPQIQRLIDHNPSLFIRTNIHEFGLRIMELKKQGYTDLEVINIFITFKPEVFLPNLSDTQRDLMD
jgi:hypothetical protein